MGLRSTEVYDTVSIALRYWLDNRDLSPGGGKVQTSSEAHPVGPLGEGGGKAAGARSRPLTTSSAKAKNGGALLSTIHLHFVVLN
jgi:hypothetical protein